MRILIVNGVNLGLLGSREVDVYGATRFEDYLSVLSNKFPGVSLDYFQSDKLEELVDAIHKGEGYDGVVLNPGAYTHTSLVLADAVKAIRTRVVEVHITNLFAREQYRRKSCLAGVCCGFIAGFGLNGYDLAIQSFLSIKP